MILGRSPVVTSAAGAFWDILRSASPPGSLDIERSMAPTQLDRFEVIGEIATFPTGAIYRATDTKFGRTVALRTYRLDAQGPAAESLLQRARAEAAAAASLNSGNIVTLYGSGEAEGVFYVAMEFVEGVKLEARIARKGISTGELIDYSRQVCMAFDHAATHGIFHRNLRPANIIEEWDGAVKIMDFGIAKSGYRVTQPGGVPDALYYMSPEQLRGAKLDIRSSLFSWAAILYFVVTGRRPFEGASVDEVRKAILEATPKAAIELAPSLSPGINQAIMKALSKAAGGRFNNGREMVAELENHQRLGRPEYLRAPSIEAEPRPAPVIAINTKAPVPLPATSAIAAMSPLFPGIAGTGGGPAASASTAPPTPPWYGAAANAQSPSQPAPPSKSGNRATSSLAPPSAAAAATPPGTTPAPQTLSADPAQTRSAPSPAQRTASMRPPTAKRSDLLGNLLKNQNVVFGAVGLVLILITAIATATYIRHTSEIVVSPATQETQPAPPPPAAPEPASPSAAAPEPQQQATVDMADPDEGVVISPRRRKMMKAAASVPTTGGISVSTTPDRATVQIDGRADPMWITPYVASGLAPGQHTIVVSKAGFQSQSRTVEVQAGARTALTISLPEALATVALQSEPAGARVFADGRDTGKTTPAQLSLSKGNHSFVLKKAGYLDEPLTSNVAPGQTLRLSQKLRAMGNISDVRTAGGFKKLFGGGMPKDMGALEIRSNPKGATIMVNNRVMEKTTPAAFYLHPGAYVVVIKADGYKPVQKIVSVQQGGRLTLDEVLPR